MPESVWLLTVFLAFTAGLMAGQMIEARLWRIKGDHDYMNIKESDGKLYIVKREPKP